MAPIGAPIAFGTSGWRGIAGEDFTLPRVRIAARAVADWLRETGSQGEVVLAHDTRPGGAEFADATSEILRASGFSVARARAAIPTPAATRAVVRRGAVAAVVFTASHNPPEYAGMKVFGASGGTLGAEQTRRIESLAAAAESSPGPAAPPGGAGEAEVDFVADYVADLRAELDAAALARGELQVIYDAMHGAGAGVLDRVLAECGRTPARLRGDSDPGFGGGPPDPIAGRLHGLVRAVSACSGPALGLATDGDADRFAVVDAGGRLLSETEAVALLVDHLARTGRIERGVAISVATGSLVEAVARSHGLRVERYPIGFKHLSRALREGGVDAAGEESGGFALGRFGCDKDGILAGCLFAEMLAQDSTKLATRLALLEERHGRRVCGRTARALDGPADTALAALLAAPPARVDGAAVREVLREDGLRLALDDGFLMIRASGTEPLLRIYAEAPSAEMLAQRLAAGAALVAG